MMLGLLPPPQSQLLTFPFHCLQTYNKKKREIAISEATAYKQEEQQALSWLLPESQRMKGEGNEIKIPPQTFYKRL